MSDTSVSIQSVENLLPKECNFGFLSVAFTFSL